MFWACLRFLKLENKEIKFNYNALIRPLLDHTLKWTQQIIYGLVKDLYVYIILNFKNKEILNMANI